MNTIKKLLVVIVFLVVICLGSCQNTNTPKLEEVTFSNMVTSITKGNSLTIDYSTQESVTSTWVSSNPSVLAVDNNTITALAIGNAKITVTFTLGDQSKVYEFDIEVLGTEYLINYLLNGGTLPSDAPKSYFEGKGTALPIPEKPGYEFLGWALSNASTKYITSISESNVGNFSLYAKWRKIPIYSNIVYNLDGGLNPSDAPENYEEGNQVTLPIPEKDGYEFLGWSLESGSTDYIRVISKNQTGEVVLFANWKVSNRYRISYVYDEGMLPTHGATSNEEFANAFWNDYYEFMEPGVSLESFKTSALAAWSKGDPGVYIVFMIAGKEVVNNAYFVNAKAHLDTIKVWFDAFDQVLSKINHEQNAWEQQFVAYKRLYEILTDSTASYWTAERKEMVYQAYPVKTPLIESYEAGTEVTLVELVLDDGRTFLGWYDQNGNKVEKISADTKGHLTLTAKFTPPILVEYFEIKNEISRMAKYTSHQLIWELGPEEATNKKVKFATNDKFTVRVNEDGFLEAVGEGTAVITITVLGNPELSVELTIEVYVDPFIDGEYVTESYVEPENTITLKAILHKLSGNILWESKNEGIATVSADGVVTGIKEGYVEIVAYAEENPSVSLTFGVTVIPLSESEFFKLIAEAHNEEVYVVRGLDVAYGAYYTDVIGSVSDLFYNYDYKLNKDYYFDRQKETMKSIEYITVHYSGMPLVHQDGEVIAKSLYNNYVSGGYQVSTCWHYSTGNDGIFQSMPDYERAGHAGDGTGSSRAINWTNSGIRATANVKPEYGMKDGYLTINGEKSNIVLPTGSNMRLTWFGPAWKVEDGYYYIAKLWYSDDYKYISSHGGNMNSIGIESACNEGSDLWYTYHVTAQLVANLLNNHNLDTTRVTGHHMWSGKDCPQTLLENDGELWHKFMELVESEYKLIKQMGDYTITAKFNNPELLSENGRVLYVPNQTTTVSYTVTVTNNTTGITKTATFSSIIHGAYTE